MNNSYIMFVTEVADFVLVLRGTSGREKLRVISDKYVSNSFSTQTRQ